MAATYCTILESEFDAIFKPEKNWVKEFSGHAQEIVYTKQMTKSNPNVQIRVYSSIHKDSSVSRPCGKDSIKVCAINTKTSKGVRKTKRIHRTIGWEGRLISRVWDIWKDLSSS